jgi:hypothetical protein
MYFNIIADMLVILIARAEEDGQAGGIIPHLVEGKVSNLQYADTILFMEHELQKATAADGDELMWEQTVLVHGG